MPLPSFAFLWVRDNLKRSEKVRIHLSMFNYVQETLLGAAPGWGRSIDLFKPLAMTQNYFREGLSTYSDGPGYLLRDHTWKCLEDYMWC